MRLAKALFFAVFAMLAQGSIAATLDSTISGVYLAPDRACNLVVSRPPFVWDGTQQRWWVVFDLQCLTFAGQYRRTKPVLYVYTGCPSFGSGVTIPDYSAAPFEFSSIRSATPQSLQVIRSNDEAAAINGIGTPETWLRVAPLASPAPYSCAGQNISKPGR